MRPALSNDEKDRLSIAISEAVDRGKKDLAFTAPELFDWRWDLIKADILNTAINALDTEHATR